LPEINIQNKLPQSVGIGPGYIAPIRWDWAGIYCTSVCCGKWLKTIYNPATPWVKKRPKSIFALKRQDIIL